MINLLIGSLVVYIVLRPIINVLCDNSGEINIEKEKKLTESYK